MLIQVLGPGCAKCAQLAINVEAAAKEVAAEDSGFEYVVEKVTDIVKIMSFDVIVTPALVLDGKVINSGKLLTVAEVKAMIREELRV